MEHRIVHTKPFLARSGVDLIVHLEFDDDEHRLIKDNNMDRVPIIELAPTVEYKEDEAGKKTKVDIDNNIYFSRFYGRRTSWHADSVMEAKDLHAKIYLGLQRFKDYLEQNKTPATHSEGDFTAPTPQPFSVDLIPDYMWAEHAYVLAESGGGKTQLLQTIIAQQMKKPKPPGFVIIDSQNQMLQLLKEKYPQAIMIDPMDNPPSLDLFSPTTFAEASTLSPTLDTFRYLFEAGNQPLTDRQRTPFEYGVALMLLGYPKAYGHNATIDDFEDYLTGAKKGAELTPRAHKAVDCMPDDVKGWYHNQYGNFKQSHSEIAQRLSNICGQWSPLRPLFSKQRDTLNLLDAVENGAMMLVNTNRNDLGPYASSFFGRFMFKLLDRNIGARNENSHPLIFIADEVHEYFDATVITPFINLARKRNISCIFAHQRLSQLDKQPVLHDALTGVATLITTNVNDNDVRTVASKFRCSQEQVHTWRKEYVPPEQKRYPTYADFGLFLRGKVEAETFRLTFGELDKEPSRKQQQREEPRQHQQEQSKQERPTGPPKEDEYDDRYDLLTRLPLSPIKAKNGTVFKVILPGGSEHLEPIPPGTKDGYRFCVKGASRIRRPDNRNGNYWVELVIAEMPGAGAAGDNDETDAKPW